MTATTTGTTAGTTTGLWQSLTPRGRGFLAAGGAALGCGIALGERDLVAIGAALALLPVVAALWLAREDGGVEISRTLARQQVETGNPVGVELHITTTTPSRRRLLVHESLSPALGDDPRFVVSTSLSGEPLVAGYTVRTQLRGSFPIGPASVATGDPFGLVSRRRELAEVNRVVVTPRPEPLPGTSTLGGTQTVGEFHPRSFIGGDATDVTVRDYRWGDDLRRVHWPSTAHAGTLMVRREERPRQTSCSLLLDNRAGAHRGAGAHSSLEYAVRATASIAVHLMGRGCRVQVYDAGGLALTREDGPEPGSSAEELLAALAILPASSHECLLEEWRAAAAGGFIVALLGALGEADHALLGGLAPRTRNRIALSLDVDSWVSGPATAGHDAPALLQAAGWRTARLTSMTQLRDAWQGLAR